MLKITLLIIPLLLAGCATGYHSNGITGGFSETQYAPDAFRVTFRGNGYTSMERAQDLTMLRCAELTMQRGFRYFVIADENRYSTSSTITTHGSAYTTGNAISSGQMYGNTYQGSTTYRGTTTYVPGQNITFNRPTSDMLIRCFKEEPADVQAFDAQFLWASLSAKYR